jgi:hypothetical protein
MMVARLEPFAEVRRAVLVMEVLEAPNPELGSLLILRSAENCLLEHFISEHVYKEFCMITDNILRRDNLLNRTCTEIAALYG